MAKARWLRSKNKKYVVLTSETVEMLKMLQYKNESYDSIIRRLIKAYTTKTIMY